MRKTFLILALFFLAGTAQASDITWADKASGSQFTHTDANEIKTAVNSKEDALVCTSGEVPVWGTSGWECGTGGTGTGLSDAALASLVEALTSGSLALTSVIYYTDGAGSSYKTTVDDILSMISSSHIPDLSSVYLTSATAASTYVPLAGNASISGVKTFTSFPVSPSSAPTTDYQFSNKKYVDDSMAAAGAGDITAVVAGTGLSGGADTGSATLNLASTAVTAGSYTRATITVDAQGRLTLAANGAALVDDDIPDTITAGNYLLRIPNCLAAVPGTPQNGQLECANGNDWQVHADQGTDDWMVRYNSTAEEWVGEYNLTTGNPIVSQIEEAVAILDDDGAGSLLWEFNFSAPRTISIPGDADATLLVSGGAGGTPSSITLTNGTGLPLAGVVDSTSEALGVGSLELGHASDTTFARSAAGVPTVEGRYIPTSAQTRRIYVSDDCDAETGMATGDLCFEY